VPGALSHFLHPVSHCNPHRGTHSRTKLVADTCAHGIADENTNCHAHVGPFRSSDCLSFSKADTHAHGDTKCSSNGSAVCRTFGQSYVCADRDAIGWTYVCAKR
jgi:hypothetical protein